MNREGAPEAPRGGADKAARERSFYALRALRTLKHASLQGSAYRDDWQAGKSVETIREIEPAGEVVRRFAAAVG